MHLCFIVEERYRRSRLPMAVANEVMRLGHDVTVVEPHASIVSLTDLVGDRGVDAVVLRTVSGGPGLSLLEAAAAAGITTINDAQAIRRVRDKVVTATLARAHDLPFPETYFVTRAALLDQVPDRHFPMVVKPNVGGFGHGIRLLRSRAEARALDPACFADAYLVAQPWVPNPGYDIKLYNTGRGIHAVRRRSPLLDPGDGPRELIAVTPALRRLAERVGCVFGLQLYGVDVVRGPQGWVAIDINDFPSFGMIPDAVAMVTSTVLDIARKAAARSSGHTGLAV
jgi:ribosomal protein S6--L-glutamate ligase